MPPRYDSVTLSLEQFGDLDSMSLVEEIGSLKVHEMRLSERDLREEEQALLSRAMSKFKKTKQDEDRHHDEEAEEEAEEEEEEEWWRTTPFATKTRFNDAGGALLRSRIYPLIFISLL